jgi:hypothetical protein
MTNRAILDALINRTFSARFLQVRSIQQQDELLDQIEQGLYELKLRGDQLQFPLENHGPGDSK